MFRIILLGVFMLAATLVSAEEVRLKSGAVKSGDIVEKTDEDITLRQGEATFTIPFKLIVDDQAAKLKALPNQNAAVNVKPEPPAGNTANVPSELPAGLAAPVAPEPSAGTVTNGAAEPTAAAAAPGTPEAGASDAGTAGTDPFDSYSKYYTRRHYLLDNQNFSRISCLVEASHISQLVGMLHERFDAPGSPAKLTENLSEFYMIYTKTDGLQFKRPMLEVKLDPSANVQDREQLNDFFSKIQAQFDQMIVGTVNHLLSFFDDLRAPDRNKAKILAFSEKDGVVKVRKETEEMREEVVYEGLTATTKMFGDMSGEGKETFREEGGLLLLDQSELSLMVGQLGTIKLQMDVEYQKVRDVTLPSKITFQTGAREDAQARQDPNRQIDMVFKDCLVE